VVSNSEKFFPFEISLQNFSSSFFFKTAKVYFEFEHVYL